MTEPAKYTAKATFQALAILAAANLLPQGRADAVAKTLNEQAEGLDTQRCSPGELGRAFAVLAQGRPDDTPPTTSRRATCAELAALLLGKPHQNPADVAKEHCATGDLEDAVATWWGIHDTLKGDDGRASAMRATAEREAHELRSRISDTEPKGPGFRGAVNGSGRFG